MRYFIFSQSITTVIIAISTAIAMVIVTTFWAKIIDENMDKLNFYNFAKNQTCHMNDEIFRETKYGVCMKNKIFQNILGTIF